MYKIKTEDLQKVLNYLQSQRWGDVNQLIVILSKLEKLENVEEIKQDEPV